MFTDIADQLINFLQKELEKDDSDNFPHFSLTDDELKSIVESGSGSTSPALQQSYEGNIETNEVPAINQYRDQELPNSNVLTSSIISDYRESDVSQSNVYQSNINNYPESEVSEDSCATVDLNKTRRSQNSFSNVASLSQRNISSRLSVNSSDFMSESSPGSSRNSSPDRVAEIGFESNSQKGISSSSILSNSYPTRILNLSSNNSMQNMIFNRKRDESLKPSSNQISLVSRGVTSDTFGPAMVKFKESLLASSSREGFEVDPTQVYCGNLPKGATRSQVMNWFSKYGTIVKLFIPKESPTYSFITFQTEEQALIAIKSE